MKSDQSMLIDKMFEYNLWANVQMIELCSGLGDEQLTVEAVGVFGRVQPILIHLIQAEGGYLNRLTGSRPWADDLNWDHMSFSDLLEKAQLSGRQLIEIATKVDPSIQHEVELQGNPFRFYNWTVLLQALYHGIEHRTQLKFLLTKLGVTHPDFSVWDYTESLKE